MGVNLYMGGQVTPIYKIPLSQQWVNFIINIFSTFITKLNASCGSAYNICIKHLLSARFFNNERTPGNYITSHLTVTAL